MEKPIFHGIIPPMLSPLTEAEEIDTAAVRRTVDFLVTAGVHGLFVLGSIGEGPFLRPRVRREMAAVAVEAAAGRVPVLAGVLESSTARVLDEMVALADTGVSAFVVTTPYYYAGYNAAEIHGHFWRIASASRLPILAYNIPQNTQVQMKADLLRQVVELPNLVGIKDSGGDWIEFQRLLLERPDRPYAVLQGQEAFAGASLLAGADGLVPGHANMWPELLLEMQQAAKAGNIEAVWASQSRLNGLLQLRGRAMIHTYKVVAKAMGLMGEHVASPLPRLSPSEAEACVASHAAAGVKLLTIKEA